MSEAINIWALYGSTLPYAFGVVTIVCLLVAWADQNGDVGILMIIGPMAALVWPAVLLVLIIVVAMCWFDDRKEHKRNHP